MALTSRPPSGRNSFWYTSTENCGTLDFEKLAMPAHIPLVPRRGGAMTVDGPVPTGPSGLPRTRPRAPLAVLPPPPAGRPRGRSAGGAPRGGRGGERRGHPAPAPFRGGRGRRGGPPFPFLGPPP